MEQQKKISSGAQERERERGFYLQIGAMKLQNEPSVFPHFLGHEKPRLVPIKIPGTPFDWKRNIYILQREDTKREFYHETTEDKIGGAREKRCCLRIGETKLPNYPCALAIFRARKSKTYNDQIPRIAVELKRKIYILD